MKLQLLSLLKSKGKWEKIGLLVRERAIMTRYIIIAPFRKLFSKTHSSQAPSVEAGVDESLPSRTFAWQYTSRLDIPADVLVEMDTRYEQDKVQADGSLLSEFDYSCAVYSNASFYSNGTTHVSAFDCYGRRIEEFSSIKFNRAVPAVCRLNRSQFLRGTTLSLYGNVENATGNAGHWLIDGISRLFLALQHIDISEIDYFLVPKFKYGFQLESLLALGMSLEQIVEIEPLECVHCEHLVLTNKPRGHSSGITPGWLIDGYRDYLLPAIKVSEKRRRIYISRRDAGSRKFVDEEQIIANLETLGFEALELSNFNFMEKIELFANAEVVVGLTGAGLTNLMFCSPDTKVIELFPESFVSHIFASKCSHLQLDYHYLIFESQSTESKVNRHFGKLHLEPAELVQKVNEVMTEVVT